VNLTKSDFKVARTCPTKLYYRKRQYPSLNDDDSYLQLLADGGYMVETMAKLLFAEGRTLPYREDPLVGFKETSEALSTGDCTLFEATVLHQSLLARIDILRREGARLKLIEVKSSSIDSDKDGPTPFRTGKGRISSEWRPYLEDVTFQTVVAGRAFPQFEVVPFLCVIDKAKSATANVTFDKFRLQHRNGSRVVVEYLGNVQKLREQHVLAIVDISEEVKQLRDEVERAADKFALTLQSDPIGRVAPEIGKKCKECEYRLSGGTTPKNGFRECWDALADPDPHVLDIYRVDLVGGKNHDAIAKMAAKGRAGLADIPRRLLVGVVAGRQRLQLKHTATGKEYVDAGLHGLLSKHPYPLHFIDFEGSRLAIPYYEGMRPYEQASFQWSCHTILGPGEKVEHSEWLNSDVAFPNFEFVRTLRNQIGNAGTVYIWSNYELVILRDIRQQMEKYGKEEHDLAEWIDTITSRKNPRVVDLCEIAREHYFHPAMKGSVSIKHVLPAVWEADATLRSESLFEEYVKYDRQGNLLDPYATLPPLPIGKKEEVVKEGTGAMRVYQDMMFGKARLDVGVRENYRKLLLQYCKLDTAAMVAIWMHWQHASGRKSRARLRRSS
jgi:hypothetical protein